MRDGRFFFFCPALSFHLSSCVMVLSPFFELYGWNGLNQRSPAQGAYKAIRVSLNACGRRIAMSTRKLKCQWIKIWGKMDNDIFFLFCLLMFYLPVNAQEPSGSFAQAQKWNTDSTDATDLIFSRILYCLLDLNRIFLRLSARDFSFYYAGWRP